MDEQTLLVAEYRLSFLERDPVLSLIRMVLCGVPLELEVGHGLQCKCSVVRMASKRPRAAFAWRVEGHQKRTRLTPTTAKQQLVILDQG
jgi:hypothetical protein